MSGIPELPEKLNVPVRGRVDVLIIAGEHSGDEHAAVLVKQLLMDRPELCVAAVGGSPVGEGGSTAAV